MISGSSSHALTLRKEAHGLTGSTRALGSGDWAAAAAGGSSSGTANGGSGSAAGSTSGNALVGSGCFDSQGNIAAGAVLVFPGRVVGTSYHMFLGGLG